MAWAPSAPISLPQRLRLVNDLLKSVDKGRNDSTDNHSVSIRRTQMRQKHVLALLTPHAGALLRCAWHPLPRAYCGVQLPVEN